MVQATSLPTIAPLDVSTLNDLLEQSFEQPKAIAAVMYGRKLSYGQLNQFSYKLAAYLQDLGLVKGDRVAVMLPNILQYPVVVAAVIRAGLVLVNINPVYSESEIQKHLSDAKPSAIFGFQPFLSRLNQVLNPELHTVIVCHAGDLLSAPLRLGLQAGNRVVDLLSFSKSDWPDVRVIGFTKATRFTGTLKPVEVQSSDMALLQYTGGTSGELKAAIISHGNLIANLKQCEGFLTASFEEDTQGIPDVILTALPLFHIFSFFMSLVMCWHRNRCALLVPNPRNIDSLLSLLKAERVTIFLGINTLFKALIRHPKFNQIDFSGFKLTVSGAMALEPEVADRWHHTTGLPILQGYGLTEASPVVTASPIDVPKYNGTVGIPLPDTQIKIVDSNDRQMPTGGIGEILIKGPQVISSYWQRSNELNQYFSADGFFRTGDIGSFDSRGFLRIIDRKKDMMIISGFNVYPLEIETVLETHPEIHQAGVVGCADEDSGERPVAFIVPADSHISVIKIDEWIRGQLTPYKCPVRYHLIDRMPISTIGKLKRTELKKMLDSC